MYLFYFVDLATGNMHLLLFKGMQQTGGSTQCFSIGDGVYLCSERGRDGWAGPPGASRCLLMHSIIDPLDAFGWRVGEKAVRVVL